MRDQIAEAAKMNGRSMNAEIVDRLEKSSEKTPESLISLLAHLEARATKAEFMVAALRRLASQSNEITRRYVTKVHPKIAKIASITEMEEIVLLSVELAEKVISGPVDQKVLQEESTAAFEVWKRADEKMKEIAEQQNAKLEKEISNL